MDGQFIYRYTAKMSKTLPFSQGSLLFAPLEGITDPQYRKTVMVQFPEWDRYSTDFLRITSEGHYKDKHLIHHFGEELFQNEKLKHKTTYQVLAATNSNTEYTIKQLSGLGFKHVDLNLGCPSRRVNAHGGGAYLMSSPEELRPIVRTIRQNFPDVFTVKIRVGYKDDSRFLECLNLFENEGVDGVTIHARTRDQMYKGVANWEYIEKATQNCSLPVIGNGDVWNKKDVENLFSRSNCHSIMFGRPAMKTPWLPLLVKGNYSEEEELSLRSDFLGKYFYALKENYAKSFKEDSLLLRRFKAVSRYLFDDYKNPEELKKLFMRAKSSNEFLGYLPRLNDFR